MTRRSNNSQSKIAGVFVAALGIAGHASAQTEGPTGGTLVDGYCFFPKWEYASRWTLSKDPAAAAENDGYPIVGVGMMSDEEAMAACAAICEQTPPCLGASFQYFAAGSDAKKTCYLKTWDAEGTAKPCMFTKAMIADGGKLDMYAMVKSPDGTCDNFTWRPKGDFMECGAEQAISDQWGDAWMDGPTAEVPAAVGVPAADVPAAAPVEPTVPTPVNADGVCFQQVFGGVSWNVYENREYLASATNEAIIANVPNTDAGIVLAATEPVAMLQECAEACSGNAECSVVAVYTAAAAPAGKACWMKRFETEAATVATCTVPADVRAEENFMEGVTLLVQFATDCDPVGDATMCGAGTAEAPMIDPTAPNDPTLLPVDPTANPNPTPTNATMPPPPTTTDVPASDAPAVELQPETGAAAGVVSASMALVAAGVLALFLA